MFVVLGRLVQKLKIHTIAATGGLREPSLMSQHAKCQQERWLFFDAVSYRGHTLMLGYTPTICLQTLITVFL